MNSSRVEGSRGRTVRRLRLGLIGQAFIVATGYIVELVFSQLALAPLVVGLHLWLSVETAPGL